MDHSTGAGSSDVLAGPLTSPGGWVPRCPMEGGGVLRAALTSGREEGSFSMRESRVGGGRREGPDMKGLSWV